MGIHAHTSLLWRDTDTDIYKLTGFSLAFIFFFHSTFNTLESTIPINQLANNIPLGCVVDPIILINACVLAFIC